MNVIQRGARLATAAGCLLWFGAAVAQGPTSGLAGGTSDGYSSLPDSQRPPASRGNTPSTGGGPTTQTGKATKDEATSATQQDQMDVKTATVEQVDRSKHTIKLGGMDKSVRMNPQAEITRDGAPASFADIREGDQVRASFSGPSDDQMVSHLDIVSGASQSGTGSSGSTSNGGGSSGSSSR